MKKLTILLLIILAAPTFAQVQTTTITGTVYDYFNQPMPNHPYTIKEMRRGRMIIPMTDFTDYTDSLGVLTFNVPRSNFATFDTTKIRLYINAPEYNKNGDRGVWLIVPDAPTAELSTLPPALYLGPPGFAVLIPPQGGGYGDSIRIADSLARYALELAQNGQYGDSIRVADSLAHLAVDSALAALDSARLLRSDLVSQIALLQGQLDTAGAAARGQIEADIETLFDSLAIHQGRISALEVAMAGKLDSETDPIAAPRLDAHDDTLAQHTLWILDNRRWEDSIAVHRQRADAIVAGLAVINDTLNVWRPLVYAPSGSQIWTDGTPSDSAGVLGGPTNKKGAHVYGGIKAEGGVTAKGITSTTTLHTAGNITTYGKIYPYWNEGIIFEPWPSGWLSINGYAMSMTHGYGMTMTFPKLAINSRVKIGSGMNESTTIPNRFELDAHIKQHKDSTADLGTVNAAQFVTDTVRTFSTDSLEYVWTWHDLPITSKQGHGGVAMGEVTFRMLIVGQESRVFRIVADTANGYELQNIHWRTNGGYQYSVSENSLIGEAEGNIQRGSSSSAWVNGNIVAPASRSHGLYPVNSALPYGGQSVVITHYPSIASGNNRTMITLRITYFKQTATGYSSMPVKIVEE